MAHENVRQRALESIGAYERESEQRAQEQAAREAERLSQTFRGILRRIFEVPTDQDPGLPDGAVALALEGGLLLKASPSRYGVIAQPGVTCGQCDAFACFESSGVTSLAELGLAYRQLERLAGAPPCELVSGTVCGRKRAEAERRDRALGPSLRPIARRLWEILDVVDRGLPAELDREERLGRLARAAERAMRDELEDAMGDRTLGAALRSWLDLDLARRGG